MEQTAPLPTNPMPLATPDEKNTPLTTTDEAMASHARRLSANVANGVFATHGVYPDQMRVLERLVMMKFKLSSIKPAPVLYVKVTGVGKSLVRDVHSVLCQGFSLIIVPVLSLGADQCRKSLIRQINHVVELFPFTLTR